MFFLYKEEAREIMLFYYFIFFNHEFFSYYSVFLEKGEQNRVHIYLIIACNHNFERHYTAIILSF